LKEDGIGLGIVSNRGARPGRLMMRQLEANGLAEFFDAAAVVWSDEVGFSKPDPGIYLACLRALEVPPERAAHVGDNKAKDVAGARQLGMATIRYAGIRDDHKDGPEADTVIFHYHQLLSALAFARNSHRADELRV
jgi:FMN phosphatase YigB (HAD superfamily)